MQKSICSAHKSQIDLESFQKWAGMTFFFLLWLILNNVNHNFQSTTFDPTLYCFTNIQLSKVVFLKQTVSTQILKWHLQRQVSIICIAPLCI